MTLFEKLIKKPNLYSAWKSLKKNPTSQGIDGITIKGFQDDLNNHILRIRRDLKDKKYSFNPLKGSLLPKDDGSSRPLRIPTVRDRVVQRAIRNVIDKYFKRFNYHCSYGYIERRSRENALHRIISLREQKYKWVLEADIESFFDTINQEVLINKINQILPDKSIDHLIQEALNAEIGNKDYFSNDQVMEYFPDGNIGIPQGGILSPLYANLYLCEFDKIMLENKFRLIRYADDFVVLCKSRKEAVEAHDKAKDFLEKQLSLKLHPLGSKKTRIIPFSQGFDFLGFSFNHENIFPREKSRREFKKKITEITNINSGDNLIDVAYKLKNTINGWGNAYSFCHAENIKSSSHDQTMPKILDALNQHIGLRFFKLLQYCEIRSAGKKWGEFHLRKFGIPNLMSFLNKRTLQDILIKRKKITKQKSKVNSM